MFLNKNTCFGPHIPPFYAPDEERNWKIFLVPNGLK